MLIVLSWLPSGKHLLILRWASCGEKKLSTRRQDPEKKTCQRPQIAFPRLATRRHWFCTSASYDNQPNGCQTHRHWCNSIVFDCYIIKLQRRRDHTSAGEVHNLATWCPNCYFGLTKAKAKTRQLSSNTVFLEAWLGSQRALTRPRPSAHKR